MFADNQLVDRIVQEVLREIASRRTPEVMSAQTEAPVTTIGESAIMIEGKVITEAVLADAGAAGRLVTLNPGSVVTPSGRDFIRRHGVRISSSTTAVGPETSASKSASSKSPRELARPAGWILQIGRCAAATGLAEILKWELTFKEEEQSAAQEAARLAGAAPILVVGGNSALVACLLNRRADIRAAVMTRPASAQALIAGMNPNIVCCDCVGWTVLDLVHVGRQMGTVQRAPAGWKEIEKTGVIVRETLR